MTENLQRPDKLIDHLSREIETHTKALMEFRTKINFTLFIGPFIVLGSYLVATKDFHIVFYYDVFSLLPAILLSISWIALGVAAARVEKHIWDQYNQWRILILHLQSPDPPKIVEKDIVFEHNLRKAYLRVYFFLLVGFVSTVILLANDKTPKARTNFSQTKSICGQVLADSLDLTK